MNAATRKKLFDALTEVLVGEGDPMTIRFVTENTNDDLDKLAPAIDQLLRAREAELLKPMICGHPTAELELAPIEEQPAFRSGPTETGLMVLDAKMIVYRCAGCRRQHEFVRKVVEHLKIIFKPCGEECSRMTPGEIERQMADIT